MSVFDTLGAASAKALLATSRATGSTFTFNHRGGGAVTLYGTVLYAGPLGNALGGFMSRTPWGRGGFMTDEISLIMLIPVQTGIATVTSSQIPIGQGDTIVYKGRTYVVSGEALVDELHNGYVWRVTAIQRQTRSAGPIP